MKLKNFAKVNKYNPFHKPTLKERATENAPVIAAAVSLYSVA